MRLEHLQYLLEIDKCRSISAAAQKLYLGQTTLSSIVRGMEEEWGFAIFQRTHDGIVATPEGEEALALAWEIISRFEEVKELKFQSLEDHRTVHLIGSPSINAGLALPLSKMFCTQEAVHKGLIFHEAAENDIGAKIAQNEANIGLTYFSSESYQRFQAAADKYQIQVKQLLRDHFYLLVRRDHALAACDAVDITTLENSDFAILSHFNVNGDSLAFIESLSATNRFTTFSNVSLIKRAVVEQNMLGILSGYAIYYDESIGFDRLQALFLTGLTMKNEMGLYLLHHGNHNLHYLEKTILKCIEDYFSELSPPPFSPEWSGRVV